MTTKTNSELNALNLQLFAEGSGTGAEGSTADSGFAATEGVKDNPLANVKYGIQEEDGVQTADAQETTETEPVVDREAEFEKLIKGDYKDLYDAKVQSTIQNRLKGTKEQVAKLESLSPLLDMIGKKYGVDSSDVKALIQAIEDDDSYFAEEALERGITVDELKRIRKIERENAEFKKANQEREAQERADMRYRTWLNQTEEAKKLYPNLDLKTELKNEAFGRLLLAGVDVGSAYLVTHKDEIIGGAMQHTAQQVEKKITNKIRANGSRPVENGISSQSAAVVKTDVSQFNDADMDEILRRVRNGEKIRL